MQTQFLLCGFKTIFKDPFNMFYITHHSISLKILNLYVCVCRPDSAGEVTDDRAQLNTAVLQRLNY